MFKIGITISIILSVSVSATDYKCGVTKKISETHEYSERELAKEQSSVLIEENEGGVFLSRCSYAYSSQKVTCDRYEVNKIVSDELSSGMKIKKYYVYRGQFDVQLYPDLSFIENNGRGSIAYGKCNKVSP